MASTLKDSIIHWKRKLEKNSDEDTILNVIRKLSKVPMTIEILQETHVGKTIRNLSKRSDIVGEKALAVLKKWRLSFANQEQPTAKTLKTENSISKKENINKKDSSKSVSKHDVPREKVHHKEVPYEHKHKHKKSSSVSHTSSEYSKNHMNGDCHVNNSSAFNHLYTYEKKETSAKSIDYDPDVDIGEEYNPECPELYPGSSKFNKTKQFNSIETYEPSSLKRKLSAEEDANSLKSKSKKPKTESHRHVDSSCNETKHKKEKHNYHKDKSKSHSSQSKVSSSEKAKQASNSEPKSSPEAKKLKKDTVEKISSKSNKSKTKLKLNSTEEFTSSEVRFEDCLGFNDIVSVKKKKSVKSSQSTPTNKKPLSTSNKASVNSSSQSTPIHKSTPSKEKYPKEISSKDKSLNVPKPSTKLEEVDIVSTLPQTQPNYRPLPQRSYDTSPAKKKAMTNEEAIKFTSSRREKTAVYSGRKTFFTEVPSLYEFCTRVLIDNIDAIEFMGEVPYFLLKPVLERCTPLQLFSIEGFNPYLVHETSELWEVHCKRDFKLLSPQENETWRELYLRAHDEQERRLKSVTANITASMCKSGPARQVKLAYVDSVVKPPREIARRQAKHGTSVPVSHSVVKPGPSKPTPKPISPAVNSSSSSSAPVIPKKPKVAPLMAKTLKSMKQCFRR